MVENPEAGQCDWQPGFLRDTPGKRLLCLYAQPFAGKRILCRMPPENGEILGRMKRKTPAL